MEKMTLMQALIKRALVFICFLLTVGFAYGSFLLLIPGRSLITFLRTNGYSNQAETIIMVLLIVFWIASLLFIVNVLQQFYTESVKRSSKAILLIIPMVVCAITIYHWLNPKQGAYLQKVKSNNGYFTAGAYPSFSDLLELKAKGYTGVISLLNPLVVPFEPVLLEREKRDTKLLGLQFINIPMLPWVSQNEDAIKRIQTIARDNQGKKYYVHCYLGEDRIRIFMRIINNDAPLLQAVEKSQLLNNMVTIRGKCLPLSDKLVACPMPVDDFFLRTIIASPIKYFVSLRGDNTQLDQESLEYDEATLEKYHIKYLHLPIYTKPYKPKAVLAIARQIKQLSQPALAYDYFMPPNSVAMEGFLIAFKADKPPLPVSLFTEPMQAGKVQVVAANIATGPQPTLMDVKNYLIPKGIRDLIYLGSCANKQYLKLKKSVAMMGVKADCFALNNKGLYMKIANDGPWYLFGPTLPDLRLKKEKNTDG